ncbi:histidine kinase N-terminal 7TM domain-containing protein [Paenibacillus sepulcri]|uniref:histidine kinase n=1 Tax=Paenibacillus sepulcri TaxID=359917 RepID=A0ABS7BZ08_9BACL|nr:PAS domain S-box protein [Paenibacillus sepulcri]
MSYNLYLSALLMAATCCTLVISYLSWKRRELPVAISYGLGVLTSAFYTFGYAFEIISPSLEHIRFWLRIEYIGIPFGTMLWFIMVLQLTGRQALVRKWLVIALMIVPVITFIAHNTNEWHHLFYRSMTINNLEGFPLVTLVKGPMYLVHVVYSYFFFIIGMILLLQMHRKAAAPLKRQITLMLIGSCMPYGFTLVYLITNMPIDISPFGFIFSSVFFLFGIYQFNMLRLAPLAVQKVFESMKDAVIVFDLDHMITGFNQAAVRVIVGLNRKQAIGQPAALVFTFYPKLLERIMQEPSSENKMQISNQDQERFFNVQVSLIIDKKLKPAGKMLLLSDVTETVRYEERLLDNARQLQELNTFKDKMFNVVAHDIRDPLAVLLNLMQLMEEEMQDCGESHEEIVHEMGQQIQKTFTLVESLLEWFQSQRGGMVFNPAVRDLARTVQMSVRFLQVRSEGKSIRILSEIPEETFVFADKEMLDLIIRNLLSNAIKFTDYGGRITLRAERAEDKMIVSVSDTGAGVPDEQIDSLLQEAYPVPSVGTAGELGVGLGLTLCREFVRLNGGEIWFDSAPSQGSTFYFSIPTPPPAPSHALNQIDRSETG